MQDNTHYFSKILEQLAKKKRVKVAIGIQEWNDQDTSFFKKAEEYADIVFVGKEIPGFACYPAATQEEVGAKLIALMDSGEVDAVVRGQIHPRNIILPLFRRMGKEKSYFTGQGRIGPIVFENKNTGRFFVLSTADLYQGFDFAQKKLEAFGMVAYLRAQGIEPHVAVMAMRRGKPANAQVISDMQTVPIIEETFEDSERLLGLLKDEGVHAEFFNIEYETALKSGANIIIPPIGPVGNAIARTLTFFSGEWEMIAAPALHFRPLALEETFKTSSAKELYPHIIAAAGLANS